MYQRRFLSCQLLTPWLSVPGSVLLLQFFDPRINEMGLIEAKSLYMFFAFL